MLSQCIMQYFLWDLFFVILLNLSLAAFLDHHHYRERVLAVSIYAWCTCIPVVVIA
jgi:hypothetical protein